MKSVVVTGASTGIGWGCVKVLTQRGFRVYGSVRKQADADRLAKDFGEAFRPLLFGGTEGAAGEAGGRQLAVGMRGETLARLVNDARIAVPGARRHRDVGAFRKQMEVNVTGQLIVTQASAPMLGAAPDVKAKTPGRI